MNDAIDIGIAGIRNEMERMQVLTEEERTALADELAEAIGIERWSPHGSDCVPNRDLATACLPIIDRYVAAHDIDALPTRWTIHTAYRKGECWYVYVEQDNDCEGYEGWYGDGEGTTMNAAIADAVRRAKAATGEGAG